MSWLWRGAQSAVFYYLSCTPFFSYLHDRRRAQERSRAKAAKATEDVEVGVYPHPLPSDTNPFWNEEVIMGPGLRRGKVSKEKAKSESTKRLNTGQDSSAGDSSTTTFAASEGLEDTLVEGLEWSKKKYQRADEHLWGSDDQTCGSYASLSSGPANKPLVSGDNAYYNARSPAVSELHPPIISNRPRHASQALWMTQPPPPAKIMEGKTRADRSRSVSNASYGSARGTGGAMAGRHASLRRITSYRLQDDLPDNMDPSPPEDDGVRTEDPERRRNRSVSDPVNVDKKRPPPIKIPSEHKQVNGKPRASTLTRHTLPRVNSSNEQNISDTSSTKSPFDTDIEDQLNGYSMNSNPAQQKHVLKHRWSMDF